MTKENTRKWAILAVVTLVSFVTNVDATIVVIGLPTLIRDLKMTIATGMWTITSYLVTSTIFLLPAGRWADVVGTKRIFVWGFALFTMATICCGLSHSSATLIGFRLIQGAGAALALATATPIIIRTFPREQLGFALGINSTSWVIGSIVGPVAGGALISGFGWRSIFFVSAPFALIGLLGGWLLRKEPTAQIRSKTDWTGTFTFGLGLTSLLMAFSQAPVWGWTSMSVLGLFGITGLCWIAFVIVESKVQDPLFNLKLFSYRHYTTGLGMTLCYCIGYFSISTLLALYLQGAQHLSPFRSGLLLLPLSAPQLLMGPFGGKLADRLGPVRLLLVGITVIAFAVLLLGNIGERTSIPYITIPLFIISVANGLAWPSLAKAVLSAAPQEQAGLASGMFYTVYNIGRAVSQSLALMMVELSVTPRIASQMFIGMGMQTITTKSAFVHVTDTGFRMYTLFFVVALLLGFFLLRPQRLKTILRNQ
ncbi:EmrB/QacA subfamily drug resistance transporter [Alicyclobacillus sacchari]|uniref:EmrB/QacA subfamily drug resistance transporter n=1 Tax=Alicyclobacillus sacchari TaxID=392010 RepID=A0A4R8LRI3_9BACL|nr:MFS transporter [Alicyclobacillus sacchari]TDY50068.1 EmrB/QacA subfamily drug resistance transporter [Alicyclobacillus sacchari]GMA57589.1 MFS transporter [Alicyclobacillus sacchari]